jgi:uncharacterized heparinase superfamily protein
VIARRVWSEANSELERVRAPRRARRFDVSALLRLTAAASVDDLWARLLARAPFPPAIDARDHERLVPGDTSRVVAAAESALARRVDLLGSGPVDLGTPIDWHRDFKTGYKWPPQFWRSIDYTNPERPSDVKIPWELSRVQWLIPCGQAYLLTGDERFALGARDVLDEWIDANPYAQSVNWAVTMEAAIRIFTWSWLFGALGQSAAWAVPTFRERFLEALYLHGDFTARNLERSDINGNHFTADAAGLTVAGTLFGRGDWADIGWRILCTELPRQVYPDGVDFEASTAYHRLVGELFLLPALYREQLGQPVPSEYRRRVTAMGRFTAAYIRPDGSAPAWGDADDARALPLDGAHPNDHRGFLGTIAAAWDVDELRARCSGPRAQAAWLLGSERAETLPIEAVPPESARFDHGGVFVLASERDHVFIDCGPVGLAGRGGHGHNDCLSLDAVLDGSRIAVDPGSYVYTASWEWRNRFRSTAVHTTPIVDGHEQATLVPELLWSLGNEATPEVRSFDPVRGVFVGAHRGYLRFAPGVLVVRTIELDGERHRLTIRDEFEGDGDHEISLLLQLSDRAAIERVDEASMRLAVDGRAFLVSSGDPTDWEVTVDTGWISPSYGIKNEAPCLRWHRSGQLRPLRVEVAPAE